MKFDKIKQGHFNTFDDIFDAFFECVEIHFSIRRFAAITHTPKSFKEGKNSILYYRHRDTTRRTYSDICQDLTENAFNNEIRIPVHGFDGEKFTIDLLIETDQDIDRKVVDRMVTIGSRAFTKCLSEKILSLRDFIVSMSLQTRDIGSFFHKAVNDGLSKVIKFDAASMFYYEYANNTLVLGATTGIQDMDGKTLKRTDIKYHATSGSYVRRCFNNTEVIYEGSEFGDLVPRNSFGEKVYSRLNRLYLPINVRDNLKRRLTEIGDASSKNDGNIGVIRIMNLKRNGVYGPISDIDFHIMEYFSEYISVLGSRYIKALNIVHDQEKATHGFITDLSTLKLQAQIFEHKMRTTLGRMTSINNHELGSIEADLDHATTIFMRNFAAVQDGMAFQLSTVLAHTDGTVGYGKDRDGPPCEKPFVEIMMRIFNARNSICGTYNRKVARITFSGEPQASDKFKRMPALRVPTKTVYLSVRNVFENSIKYTPRARAPEIDFSWQIRDRNLEIDISDNGIGIEVEDEKNLFNEGFRSRLAMRTHLRGNGLGLCVSRIGIRGYRGDLAYVGKNSSGIGSVFRITAPCNL